MKTTKNICYYISVILIVTGVIFRLLHWYGATYIILAGCVVAILSFALPQKLPTSENDDEEILDRMS
ncbi:MAG: hypothetical protein HUJ25_09785 [Crocinitomicaceae bacterium]|nr:hypothetical protein [Crocinitomicaceae bacterium]